MKIISNKKWEEMNDLVVGLQLDLNSEKEDNNNYKEQVKFLCNIKESLEEKNSQLEQNIQEQKKELKKLRQLCTRNGIKYKKDGEK